MPVKTLQQLCINVIYETLNTNQKSSVTVKESIRTQIISLSLPASVISLLIEKYENTIIEKQYPVLPLRFKMFRLDYCCVTDSMPYDPITNGYFYDLYSKYIESHKFKIMYCERSGYGIDLYAPDSITFTTKTHDVYYISYNAYTSNDSRHSNWTRMINIKNITYQRNDEEPVMLKFMFVHGHGCCALVDYDGNGNEYSMSYIGLDNKLNYVGHYFDEYMFKNEKHMQKFTKQLMDLVEKHKTSKLPFFVYFLESIPNPILRLIYLFTYMPSVFVKSGK